MTKPLTLFLFIPSCFLVMKNGEDWLAYGECCGEALKKLFPMALPNLVFLGSYSSPFRSSGIHQLFIPICQQKSL